MRPGKRRNEEFESKPTPPGKEWDGGWLPLSFTAFFVSASTWNSPVVGAPSFPSLFASAANAPPPARKSAAGKGGRGRAVPLRTTSKGW